MDLLSLKNKKSGYTLLEILVSFAIFGILLGIIVFGFRNARSTEGFKGVTALFASHISQVQNWALTGKEAGGKVPAGGYGLHLDLSNLSQYFLFADFNSVSGSAGSDCVTGAGNQRYDGEQCTGANEEKIESIALSQGVSISKVKIDYGTGLQDLNPGTHQVLDLAFQNFKPFPYAGIGRDNIYRDPSNSNYDSKRFNIIEFYFLHQGLSQCRKVTVSGASGMVQEGPADCP